MGRELRRVAEDVKHLEERLHGSETELQEAQFRAERLRREKENMGEAL